MNKIKEKLYSASEVAGRELRNDDRTFSESEVEEFSQLFSEFNDMYGDQYETIDDAYSEFFDAYSNVKMEKDQTTRDEGDIKPDHYNKVYGRAAAGAVGAGAGYGIASLLNKKDQIKRAKILKDMSVGRATSADIAELEILKKKMNKRKAIGAVAGGATGVGLAIGAHHVYKDKNNSEEDSEQDQSNNKNKNNMANNANEDQFSDEFAEYYMKNIDTYGDSEQGMEDAYNDFISTDEDEDSENTEVENQEGDNFSSEELNSHIDAFSDFYTEMEDVYGDSDEGMEEAYADFLELNSTLESDDTYSEDDFSEEELAFIEFYADTEDIYGDNLEDAYADFLELSTEDNEDEFSDEEVNEDAEVAEVAEAQYSAEDFYGDAETFVEDFADFYAEMEDVYGDDVATAFDDYADALEGMAEEAYAELSQVQTEDEYNDEDAEGEDAEAEGDEDEYSVKGAAVGAAVGGAALYGLGKLDRAMIPRQLAKNAKRREKLKAKIQARKAAGKETFSLDTKLNQLDAHDRQIKVIQSNPKSVVKRQVGGGALIGGAIGAMYSENDANVEGEDKEFAYSAKQKAVGAGMGIGAVGGLAIGAATDPNSKTRKALKAKQKSGTITASEQAQLNKLKAERRGRLMKATGAGIIAGGAAGLVANKTGADKTIGKGVDTAVKKTSEVADKAKKQTEKAGDWVKNQFKSKKVDAPVTEAPVSEVKTETKTTPAGAAKYPDGTDAPLPKKNKSEAEDRTKSAADTDVASEDKMFAFSGNKVEKKSYVLDILTKK